MASPLKLLLSRRRPSSIFRPFRPKLWKSSSVQGSVLYSSVPSSKRLLESRDFVPEPFVLNPCSYSYSRSFCSRNYSAVGDDFQGPTTIDYGSILQEDQYHKLADSTIHDLLEKIEEYGDSVDIDGFDIDYGNEVLTVKLGDLGTYVINKQTPNRQIWISSPVSGPSRFDWDPNAESWVYRRTKANLFEVLESELEQLCGRPINLS